MCRYADVKAVWRVNDCLCYQNYVHNYVFAFVCMCWADSRLALAVARAERHAAARHPVLERLLVVLRDAQVARHPRAARARRATRPQPQRVRSLRCLFVQTSSCSTVHHTPYMYIPVRCFDVMFDAVRTHSWAARPSPPPAGFPFQRRFCTARSPAPYARLKFFSVIIQYLVKRVVLMDHIIIFVVICIGMYPFNSPIRCDKNTTPDRSGNSDFTKYAICIAYSMCTVLSLIFNSQWYSNFSFNLWLISIIVSDAMHLYCRSEVRDFDLATH